MAFTLKYINVFDDINSINKDEIQEFYSSAVLKITKKFESPSFNDVTVLQRTLKNVDINSDQSIAEHLVRYASLNMEVAKHIADGLIQGLKILTPNQSTILSNYGKIAYWLKTILYRVLNNTEDNVYVQANMEKYSIYTLYLLSKLGNNVVIVDNQFKKEQYSVYNNIIFNISNTHENVQLSDKLDINFDKLIDIFNSGTSTIKGKILVIGEDNKGILNTKLVELSDDTQSNILILKCGVAKPTFEEVSQVPRIPVAKPDQLLRMIGPHMFGSKPEYSEQATEYIKTKINNMLSSGQNINKAIQSLITFICLYRRYSFESNIIICYGKIGHTSELILDFMYDIGKFIVVIDTSDISRNSVDISTWTEIRLNSIVPQHEYPGFMQSTTIAYNAKREIDQSLYNGNTLGLYKNRQYKTCNIDILHSTFDEMLILWSAENTMRSSFSSTESNVIVPVFYAKVNGCCDDYTRTLQKLITRHTIICYNPSQIMDGWQKEMIINHFADINGTMFKEQKPMYKNGRLEINTILEYRTFTYKFLDPGIQVHILEKLDEIIEKKLILHPGMDESEFVDILLNIGLNMSTRIQQEMQWYDFTKQSPKLVVLCQDREEITLEQSIVITLLHLCGWDIVIVIPTCYNIMGKYLRLDTMQEHNIGEPRFDTNITYLEPLPDKDKNKKGFLSRLFG